MSYRTRIRTTTTTTTTTTATTTTTTATIQLRAALPEASTSVTPAPEELTRARSPSLISCKSHIPSDLEILFDDTLIHIFRFLNMLDMINISQVCARWRDIALSTACLWTDVQLTDPRTVYLRRFERVVERSKGANINMTIRVEPEYNYQWRTEINATLQAETLRRLLATHSHRITSLKLKMTSVACTPTSCALSNIPMFEEAVKLGLRDTIHIHNTQSSYNNTMYIEIADTRKMDHIIMHKDLPPCVLSMPDVRELELVEFSSITRGTMARAFKMFPGLTSLTLRADTLGCLEEGDALQLFVDNMASLQKLVVKCGPLRGEEYPASMVSLLRWPVRTLEIDVSDSGNGYARRVRRVLREFLTPDSVVTIRSTRNRPNDNVDWVLQFRITLRVGSENAAREFVFVHNTFRYALLNYAGPLVRLKSVSEVVLDGHAACAMFYAATTRKDMAHLRKLRVVAGDAESIRVPQTGLGLTGLEELVIERNEERGAWIHAQTVAGLVSKLEATRRPDFRLRNVCVYGDGQDHDFGQFVNVLGGCIRQKSWEVQVPNVETSVPDGPCPIVSSHPSRSLTSSISFSRVQPDRSAFALEYNFGPVLAASTSAHWCPALWLR